MTRPYVPHTQRHGSQDIPVLRPITVKVADLNDADLFPNINAAIDYARRQRIANDG